eukprot:318341-Prymnesium_polylepis.1
MCVACQPCFKSLGLSSSSRYKKQEREESKGGRPRRARTSIEILHAHSVNPRGILYLSILPPGVVYYSPPPVCARAARLRPSYAPASMIDPCDDDRCRRGRPDYQYHPRLLKVSYGVKPSEPERLREIFPLCMTCCANGHSTRVLATAPSL